MNKTVFRILDANLNRTREGLRVIEEYLRFVREDARGSWLVKRWRHDLRQMIATLGEADLLANRAAITDVGKDMVSPSNSVKTEPVAITAASFKRVQEALRVIEEYSTAISSAAGALASQMRFEVYEFEKELFAGNPRRRFSQVRLYLLIGSDFCPPEAMCDMAGRLLDAGVDCLQLREKTLSDRQIWGLARGLSDLCRSKEKLFIVNDRADIAAMVGADGIHIGQDDLPVSEVCRWLGTDRIVGVSTHNADQLERVMEESPTYVAIGPAFDTATKPHEPTAGVEYISQGICRLHEAGIPEVAIGGITVENLPRLLERGVRRIAVCGAILRAKNPVDATKQMVELLHKE